MPEHAIVDPATVKGYYWVYLLFFFDDEDPSYVGVTDDFVKRMDDHNDVRGGAPRVAVARSAYGAFRAKIAAALYCTLLEAKALETYLMKKYNTKLQETRERIEARLHEQNPDRLAWPDIALYPLVPKSKQLNCIHSRNYMKFAAEVDAAGAAYERGETPPPKLTPEQHTQFLAQIENDWRGTVWATDGAEDSCSLVFEVDSPFARARELKEQYEEMAPHALVDRNVVSGQLLTLRQYSLGDEDADKEVQLMTKLWQKSVHPNNEALVAKPITAGYAAALFSVAYQWCGEHEEALLLAQAGIDADTDEAPAGNPGYASAEALKRRAILQGLQWRKWSEAHDGKQPRHTGKTAAVKPEEATLKDAMTNWRDGAGERGLARRSQSLYLLLLRHHNWFPPFVRGQKASGGNKRDMASAINLHLQEGFGTKQEVATGVAECTIPEYCNVCGNDNKVAKALRNFLNGVNTDVADQILAPGGKLSQSRAATLRAIHVGHIPKRQEQAQTRHELEDAVREANGRSKKQKTEAGPSEEKELASEDNTELASVDEPVEQAKPKRRKTAADRPKEPETPLVALEDSSDEE